MSKRFSVVLLAVAALVIAGAFFQRFRASAEVYRPVDPKLVSANTDFGVRLLKELVKSEKGKNVFISPASVSIVLSMVYNGADGSTKDAMAKTLGVQSMTLDQVNEANEALLANLQGQGEGVQVHIANSLWLRKDIPFKDAFLDTNRRYYSAEVTSLPFDSAGVNKINSWVSDNTGGKIPAIIDRFDPDEVMALVNAVYFQGTWQTEFDAAKTRPQPFTLSDGSKVDVPMMYRKAPSKIAVADGGMALCIPYTGGRLEFWAFLPKLGVSIASFVSALSSSAADKWMSAAKPIRAIVRLPGFRLEYKAERQIKRALTDMGMGIAFDENRADFSNMISQQAWINRVIHKTFVAVDEKGTEAAAATVVLMAVKAALAEPQFIVDRPFLCLIRDNKTKSILFIGVVEDPR